MSTTDDTENPMTALSPSKLLAVSGEFDIESIQFLSLKNQGLDNVQTLELCTGLIRLDLRQNDIFILNPLRNLKLLTALNLSANRITNIDPLRGLDNLANLNLAGNLIGSFERLKCLQQLEHLSNLRLYDSVSKLSNPVCHNLSYEDSLKQMFPNLVTLDGMRLKGFGSQLLSICKELDDQIKSERTFGPVQEYPMPSAWLQPGYFSMPPCSSKENYAVTEFKETVDSCKKTNLAAKEQIQALKN